MLPLWSMSNHARSTTTPTITTGNMRQRHYRQRTSGAPTGAALTGPRTAVIYVRISKDRENETSTASQAKACEAWCTMHGIRVAATFVDAGESAFRGKSPRPEFAKALSMLRTRNANTLVVWKLDRFMRNATTAMQVRDEIHGWGGSISSVTEALDTADASNLANQLIFPLLATLAEMESATKSDRGKAWHETRMDDGTGRALPPTGRAGYGYVKDEHGNLVIVPEHAAVIREAAQAMLDGVGLKTHTDKLNRSGAAGRTFSIGGLKHVLTSETTAGLRYDGHKHVVGNWEPILDRETWDAVCRTLMDPNRKTTPDVQRRAHLLTGIIMCECGSPMRIHLHHKGTRYVCKAVGCKIGIAEHIADGAITAYLMENVHGPAWEAMRMAGRGFDPAVIDDTKRKLKMVTKLYVDGRMDDDEYQEARAELDARLEIAQTSEYVELPAISSLKDGWQDLDVETKQLIIRGVFHAITVKRAEDGMPSVDRIHTVPKL